MDLLYIIFLFILGVVVSFIIEQASLASSKKVLLPVFCVFLTIVVGLRSLKWNDTDRYAYAFYNNTSGLFPFSYNGDFLPYSEKGFYIISSIIKTFTNDYIIYFIVISALTFIFLYKSLRKYCFYPLIGLAVYVARFMLTRNMMQIRAALAIAIVVFALQYITKKDIKKFLFCTIIASTIHTSAIIVLPLYWLNRIKMKPTFVLAAIGVSFIIAAIASATISEHVVAWSEQYNIARSYTDENSSYTAGLGLFNPMIYYQTFILLIYSFSEKKIGPRDPNFYTIRNGYFYSTLILILLSSFGSLSGRLSTITATYEIFILPSLLLLLKERNRWIGRLIIGVIVIMIFYLNISSMTFLK